MSETLTHFIGYIAAAISLVMFLPQTLKTICSKSTEGLSKSTYVIYMMGATLWVLYGSFIKPAPAWENVISDTVVVITLIPVIWLLFKKKVYGVLIITLSSLVIIGSFLISILSVFQIININVSESALLVIILIAGSLTGLSFLPQLLILLKEKKAVGFSLYAGLANMMANILWVAYWFLILNEQINNTSITFMMEMTGLVALIFTSTLAFLNFLLVVFISYFAKKEQNQKVFST